MNISPGETLFYGRFTIDSPIGSGGFGDVCLAKDQDANHPVALKIVPTVEGEEETAAQQLRNEINLRRRINNFEYIIRVNDIYVDSDYKGLPLVLLSMEYADGGSLRGWIRENIDLINQEKKRSEALSYFKDACMGVKAIHDAGLIHLDLKPENLLVMNGKVKVSDLGLSRNYIQYAQNLDMILEEQATPPYMSPEQFKTARQKDISLLSDIYTLGIILFELLDGNVPFDGKNFDEFKKKHLTYAPPPLDGALAPWGRIVERCLAKEPSKRYPSVDDLLADLDKANKGDVLSVDVACKKCGHINVNRDLKKCQKCGEDIDHFFHRCPNCRRLNRLDVEICPSENLGCGYEVGRHFRIEALLKKAHELKDVDPLGAIKDLVQVLDLDRGNREAKEMLPGLREVQEQIEEIIPQAEKAQKAGRLENARGRWQDILSLAPRHPVATEKKKELGKLIKNYNANYEQSFVLMGQGKFSKAQELLNECREMIPTRKEANEALKDLNRREKSYSQHFEKANSSRRQKRLYSARKEFELCLEEAPNSEEAIKLKAKVDKDINNAEELFNEAKSHLKAAEFEGVQRSIDAILEIQRNLSGFQSFIKGVEEKEKKYCDVSSKWKKALEPEARDLNKAQSNLEGALKICPDCSEAKELLDQVLEDKERARQLIEDARSSFRAATFTKAKNEIAQAERIWRKFPRLSQIRAKLETTQQSYNKHIDTARELYENKKDLGPALKRVEEALKVCPDSTGAKTLKNRIAGDQKRVIDLLYEATSFIPKADFGNASKYIEEAESIWPNVPGLFQVRDDLKKRKKVYNEHFKKASDLYEKKKLDSASRSAENALNTCGKSDDARYLLDKIQSAQEKAIKLVKKIQQLKSLAHFRKIYNVIADIVNTWPNVPNLSNATRGVAITEKSYNVYFKKASDLYEKKDLYSASKSVEKALSICRQSNEAKNLLSNIVSDQQRAITLINDIPSLLISADFGLAKSRMRNAASIWPSAPDLRTIRRELETKEKKYSSFYYDAKKLFDRGKKLDVALNNAHSALGICPDSVNALKLRKYIENKIEKEKELKRKKRRYIWSGICFFLLIAGVAYINWRFPTGRLYVDGEPKHARIRILNNNIKFSQGIKLEPGRYLIEVSFDYHEKVQRWVDVEKGSKQTLSIKLKPLALRSPSDVVMMLAGDSNARCKASDFGITKIDLNNDRANDLIIKGCWTSCGSGGCTFRVFVKKEGIYVYTCSFGLITGIKALDKYTKGYRDLRVSFKDYNKPVGSRIVHRKSRWNGYRYN